jgi:hypothetical protein
MFVINKRTEHSAGASLLMKKKGHKAAEGAD